MTSRGRLENRHRAGRESPRKQRFAIRRPIATGGSWADGSAGGGRTDREEAACPPPDQYGDTPGCSILARARNDHDAGPVPCFYARMSRSSKRCADYAHDEFATIAVVSVCLGVFLRGLQPVLQQGGQVHGGSVVRRVRPSGRGTFAAWTGADGDKIPRARRSSFSS